MAQVNVWERYYEAEAVVSDVPRRGALAMLVVTSEAGQICYEAAVTFFPHRDEEDYAVSYDAYRSRVLYEGKGRRSKKREAALLEEVPGVIDALAEEIGAKVFWERPLREERMG
ncbi:MAG: hypothetical protein IJM26_11170 [Lachnospiraceae bacterium]|nr:hypothetical protein [Lachnospiraceae bacterium]